MARGELLRKLFLSHQRGNEEEFRAAALEVIAEEEKKSNHRLAKDLLRILENGGSSVSGQPFSPGNIGLLPKDRERQTLLVDVRQPNRYLPDILLNKGNKAVIERVLQEYRHAELLRVHGLRPSTKLLFCGPPGCGKTLCSEIIAGELGLPLLYIRFDAVVSSYLGETAANLRKVFDYAANGRWVVLFDEFDAIGKARDDMTEHGELKRVVNSFLQLLDNFNSPSVLIAATNHEQLLDPALWRRFDEIVMFPRPSVHEIRSLLAMKLKNFPHSGLDLKTAASKLKGLSHADVERICFDAIKAAIL
ncbi:MAG: ATP-binding protein, partial [Firmicutes bacterium]|nr:ATP-binding protein [Bacillota bacterium]